MNSLTIGCYFWEHGCKVDWPAWVQAVGSVVAIYSGIWIAGIQARQAERDKIESKIDDFKSIIYFFDICQVQFDRVTTACISFEKFSAYRDNKPEVQFDFIENAISSFIVDKAPENTGQYLIKMHANIISVKILISRSIGTLNKSAAEILKEIKDEVALISAETAQFKAALNLSITGYEKRLIKNRGLYGAFKSVRD